MTTFYLIRHGSNDSLPDTLAGRAPGLHLNARGRHQAELIAKSLTGSGIQNVFSSPMERCRETAMPLCETTGIEPRIATELLEVDFGEWTGRRFAELETLPEWRQWNTFRSGNRVPGGESMVEVQSRVVSFALKLHGELPDARIALVSHGDPLRSLLLHFLGMPLDFIRRIELCPGSISILSVNNWEPKVELINVGPHPTIHSQI